MSLRSLCQIIAVSIVTMTVTGTYFIESHSTREQLDQDLLAAVTRGDCQQTDKLLKEGANLYARDSNTYTPLLLAAKAGNADLVQLLFKNGAGTENEYLYGKNALIVAAANGHNKVVAILLADPRFDINRHTKTGDTALMEAAKNDHAQTVQTLLDHGANIVQKNDYNKTALDIAQEKNHPAVIKILQKAHAQYQLDQALPIASMGGDLEQVITLLKAGACIEAKNQYGQTPLILAIKMSHNVVAKKLIEKGANIHAKDKYNVSTLSWAVDAKNSEGARLLIKHGATKNDLSTIDRDSENINLRQLLQNDGNKEEL